MFLRSPVRRFSLPRTSKRARGPRWSLRRGCPLLCFFVVQLIRNNETDETWWAHAVVCFAFGRAERKFNLSPNKNCVKISRFTSPFFGYFVGSPAGPFAECYPPDSLFDLLEAVHRGDDALTALSAFNTLYYQINKSHSEFQAIVMIWLLLFFLTIEAAIWECERFFYRKKNRFH